MTWTINLFIGLLLAGILLPVSLGILFTNSNVGSESTTYSYELPYDPDIDGSITMAINGGDNQTAEIFSTGSAMIGQTVNTITLYINQKVVIDSTGTIHIEIWHNNDALARTIGTIPFTSISTGFTLQESTHTLNFNDYTIQANDRLVVYVSGGTVGNSVEMTRHATVDYGVDYLTTNTKMQSFTGDPIQWTDIELAGEKADMPMKLGQIITTTGISGELLQTAGLIAIAGILVLMTREYLIRRNG